MYRAALVEDKVESIQDMNRIDPNARVGIDFGQALSASHLLDALEEEMRSGVRADISQEEIERSFTVLAPER